MSVFLLRHGESTANSGEDDCIDAGLSAKGVEQARAVVGRFDLAVVSPLRRAQQTLELSAIQANLQIVESLCRERVIHHRDTLVGEAFRAETDEEFWKRVELFRAKISAWSEANDTILVVGHSYFFAAAFNAWGLANCELRQAS